MSVVARVGKATGAEVLWGERPAGGRVFPKTKKALVAAVALLGVIAFAALIGASQAPNAKHYYSAGSTADQSRAVPQMSEEEALDAYGKLPLSFILNEGPDRGGGALLHPGCWLRLLLHQ